MSRRILVAFFFVCLIATVFSGRVTVDNYEKKFNLDGIEVTKELTVIGEEVLDIVEFLAKQLVSG